MNYREPLFRPPAEADSLIFQVAYGCPWNQCRFCGMYKSVRYSERPENEVLDEIDLAACGYPETQRIFLADGDVMILPFERLRRYLRALNDAFPRLARINIYANGSSILSKSREELCELRKLKLHTLYLGLETGDDEILQLVRKGETAFRMIDAVRISQEHGLRISVMVLLGLGGRGMTLSHSERTAAVLNLMQPRLLSFLRFIEVPGIRMFPGYEPVSEYEAVQELQRMIGGLDLKRTVVRANHSSNPLPLEGRLPHDKDSMLYEIQHMLEHGGLDRKGPGCMPLWL